MGTPTDDGPVNQLPEAEEPDPSGSTGAFEPIREQPRDTRAVTWQGHRLWAPASFQEESRPGPDGQSMLVLTKPARGAKGVCEVILLGESNATSTASDQMFMVETSKKAVGAGGVTRLPVTWPGSTDGAVVRWTQHTTGPDGDVLEEQFSQLALQVGPSDILGGIAVAPADEFDDCGVEDVLRTLTVKP